MEAILAQTAPAVQVNINAVAGYLMLAGLMAGLVTMVGVLLSIKKQTSELWACHLGPAAMEPATGLPRWYYSHSFTEALERFDEHIEAITVAIDSFTAVQRELIQELKLERVERRARSEAKKASERHQT